MNIRTVPLLAVALVSACGSKWDPAIVEECRSIIGESASPISGPNGKFRALLLSAIPPTPKFVQNETAHEIWFSQNNNGVTLCRVYETDGLVQMVQQWAYHYSDGKIEVDTGDVLWRPK